MMDKDPLDPKGLIRESFALDGITAGECRSIFLDWALSVPQDADYAALIAGLLNRYEAQEHPMTETLRAGLPQTDAPRRRGGRSGRMTERGKTA